MYLRPGRRKHLLRQRRNLVVAQALLAVRGVQDFLTLWKDADKDLPFYIQVN
jgi:hypothetical protein